MLGFGFAFPFLFLVRFIVYGYLLLTAAIVSEVCGTTCLGKSAGFSQPGWAAAGLLFYGVSFVLLSKVMTLMPVAVAYALWAGLGNVLVLLVGWIVFSQTPTLWSVVGIGLIVSGVGVLQLAGK